MSVTVVKLRSKQLSYQRSQWDVCNNNMFYLLQFNGSSRFSTSLRSYYLRRAENCGIGRC